MVQKLTRCRVVDTSGAGWVQVFHVYRGTFHKVAVVGDYVKSSIKQVAFYPRRVRGKRYRPLRQGYVVRGLLLHTTHPTRFLDNTRVSFPANTLALLKRRGLLKSKYVIGPILRVARRPQFEATFLEEL